MSKSKTTFTGVDVRTVYAIDINPISLLRVQSAMNINVLDLVLGPLAAELADKPNHLASIVHLLACPDEDPKTFAANISESKVFQTMIDVLLNAVVGYLPSKHGKHFQLALAG